MPCTTEPEVRTLGLPSACVQIEKRDDDKPVIVGYASVFYRADDAGTQYQLFENVYERIQPKAFERALKDGDDARALFNHDQNFVLGRRSAGTLKLSEDKRGLKYEIDPPDTQAARDLLTSIGRGDINGSSFAFFVRKASWAEEDGKDIRQIEDVELVDVGPVTYPAYAATTAGLRSLRATIQQEYEAWLAHKKKSARDAMKSFEYRARLAMID